MPTDTVMFKLQYADQDGNGGKGRGAELSVSGGVHAGLSQSFTGYLASSQSYT